jgi:diguanylate cyclase (GGDEF)-like protein
MALLDPRLIEIDILSAADRETFSGGPAYEYRRGDTMSQEDRQREAAILELMTARAIVFAKNYDSHLRGDPDFPIDQAADEAVHCLLRMTSIIPLKITQRGRLRLYRLRDEILSGRDRIRDDFGILWARRHWLPDLTVRLKSREPGTPLSLLVLDVDKLKDLNLEVGHHGADKVLTGIFEELRDVVRPHEGYRIGMGDEAGAILVGVPLDEAKKMGEELRRRIDARPWPAELKFKRRPDREHRRRNAHRRNGRRGPLQRRRRNRAVRQADKGLCRGGGGSREHLASIQALAPSAITFASSSFLGEGNEIRSD